MIVQIIENKLHIKPRYDYGPKNRILTNNILINDDYIPIYLLNKLLKGILEPTGIHTTRENYYIEHFRNTYEYNILRNSTMYIDKPSNYIYRRTMCQGSLSAFGYTIKDVSFFQSYNIYNSHINFVSIHDLNIFCLGVINKKYINQVEVTEEGLLIPLKAITILVSTDQFNVPNSFLRKSSISIKRKLLEDFLQLESAGIEIKYIEEEYIKRFIQTDIHLKTNSFTEIKNIEREVKEKVKFNTYIIQ